MNVGEKIRQRRKELQISADDLANKIGVSRSTIFRYEKGDIEKVPTHILEALAVPLKTTPAFLMGWSDDPESNTGSLSQDMATIFELLNEINRQNVYDYAIEKLKVQNKKNKDKVTPISTTVENPIITFAAHSENPDKVYTDEEKANLFNDFEKVAKKHKVELSDD